MRVSFIGLGNMGAPLAMNILEAGEELQVYARKEAATAPFVSKGAKAAKDMAELAACDVLCTCLPLPEDVERICLGQDGLYSRMAAGAIHLEFSTIDPDTANKLKSAANARDLGYAQATVGKTPAMAAKKEEPLFVGGNPEAVAKLWPLLKKIGKPENLETVEASCAFKLLSNMIGMTNLVVMAEGLRVGRAAGIELHKLLELLEETGAKSFQMSTRGPWIADNDFKARFGVDLAAKDLRLGCAMAEKWDCNPELTKTALKLLNLASKAGFGQEDACAVYKILK